MIARGIWKSTGQGQYLPLSFCQHRSGLLLFCPLQTLTAPRAPCSLALEVIFCFSDSEECLDSPPPPRFLPPPTCQHPVLCQLSQDQSFGSSASRILYLLIYRKHDSTLESLAYTLDPGCRHHLKMLRVSYVKFKYCTLWQQTAPSSFAQLLTLELFVFLGTLSCLTPAVLLYVRPCIS